MFYCCKSSLRDAQQDQEADANQNHRHQDTLPLVDLLGNGREPRQSRGQAAPEGQKHGVDHQRQGQLCAGQAAEQGNVDPQVVAAVGDGDIL